MTNDKAVQEAREWLDALQLVKIEGKRGWRSVKTDQQFTMSEILASYHSSRSVEMERELAKAKEEAQSWKCRWQMYRDAWATVGGVRQPLS
jgi:hypothetical protein